MPAWMPHGTMCAPLVKQIKHSEALHASKRRVQAQLCIPSFLHPSVLACLQQVPMVDIHHLVEASS